MLTRCERFKISLEIVARTPRVAAPIEIDHHDHPLSGVDPLDRDRLRHPLVAQVHRQSADLDRRGPRIAALERDLEHVLGSNRDWTCARVGPTRLLARMPRLPSLIGNDCDGVIPADVGVDFASTTAVINALVFTR